MDDFRVQRVRKAPGVSAVTAQRTRITEEDVESSTDRRERYPGRLPNSARRYPVQADAQSEPARLQSDSQPGRQRPSQRYSTPDWTQVPHRRTATQTDIPAQQAPRPRPERPQKPREEEAYTRDTGDDYSGYSGEPASRRRGRSIHWSFIVGIAMLTMIVGWLSFSALSNWWTVTQNDWRYGRPRTFQTDAVVGHTDSPSNPSHFIAMNLNRHIIIIEIPGGDPSKARIYTGPTLIGPGQDLAPVTLTFQDVNGDGKLDMIVNVQDTHFVFLNIKGSFEPASGQS